MVLRRFSVLVILRVILLLVTVTGFTLIFGRADLFFNQIILGGIILIQVYDLIRFVQRTNDELAKLFLAIRHSDFTVNFSHHSHSAFKSLHPAMKEIMEAYKQVKIEKEAQFQYLRLLVQHLKVGIISIKGDDEIALMNPPALDFLQMGMYHHWKNVQRKRPQFVEAVEAMQHGESRLLELSIQGQIRRLSVQLTQVQLLQESYKIITLHDIEQEINRSEMEAYDKLIRILTHEIMNSVTPISSLTETLLMMLENERGEVKSLQEVDPDYPEDLAYSLRTIQKRTDGLLTFVEDYRRLTKVPQPQQQSVSVQELIESVSRLMRGEFQKRNIAFQVQVQPEDLSLFIDYQQIEQVLINLLTNSMHAVVGKPEPMIMLKAYALTDKTVLEVTDNGEGIPVDKLDEIFVPFFSTKEKGSGIGLSLSRNIMTLHGGNIRVSSQPGAHTTFTLYFQPVAQPLPEQLSL
ncbi:MAG: ATP-binding protein [Cyclobacteriaceae bacterium]